MDYCTRVAAIHYPKTNNAKINAAMHFIQENYTRHLTVTEIAKEVGLSSEYLSFSSQSYFQSVFKKETGDTPNEYRRLNKLLVIK